MWQALLNAILGQMFSISSGVVGGGWNMLKGMFSDALDAMTVYNQRGMAFARQQGLNAKEAQAYTEVLVNRASKLAKVYGISADQVFELQENLAAATGKALMLNDAEAERMIQINKLVGASVANEFTSEIMTHMGGQLSAVQGAVSKAYATGAKSGLNAAKFSEKVAKNLSMANKLSFREGVNGIIKMTALSEKLGFNLQSVEAAASNFMDLDKSIENAAKLQMLGGAAGAFGGNPLTMAYEANYDPEAFTKRMTDTLGGLATFDRKTGVANVNGMNRDFVKSIAEAMGIGMEEAMSIAKKQAEVNYKERAYAPHLGKLKTQEQRDFILNKSYVDAATGRLMINDVNGQAHDISENGIESIISELQKFDNQDEKQIMANQAQTLIDIKETIEGLSTSFTASLAKPFIEKLGPITNGIKYIGNKLIDDIAPKVVDFTRSTLNWLTEHKKPIKEIFNFLTGTVKNTLEFISNNFKTLLWITGGILAIVAVNKLTNFLFNAKRDAQMLAKLTGGKATLNPFKSFANKWKYILGKNGEGAPAMAKNSGALSKATKSLENAGKSLTKGAKSLRNGASSLKNGASSLKGLKGGLGKFFKGGGKLLKGGGGALAIGTSAILAGVGANQYKSAKKDLDESLSKGEISKEDYNAQMAEAKNEKNSSTSGLIGAAIGGAIGSAIAPGVGTAIGAFVGDIAGNFVGKSITKISDSIKDQWNGPIKDFAKETFGEAGGTLVDGIGDIAGGLTEGYGHFWDKFADALGDFGGGLWDAWKTAGQGVWDGFGQIFQGDILGGLSTMGEGIWEGLKTYGKGLFDTVKDLFDGIFGGYQKIFSGVWDGIKKVGSGVLDIASNVLDNILEIGGKVWDKIFAMSDKAWSKISEIGGKVWDRISNIAGQAWNGITNAAFNVVGHIGAYIGGMVNRVYTIARGIWSSIGKFGEDIWNSILGYAGSMFSNAFTLVSGMWSNVSGLIDNVWGTFTSIADDAWSRVSGIASDVFSSIGSVVNGVWDRVTDAASNAWKNITSFASNTVTNIGKFASGIWNSILGTATNVFSSVEGFANRVWDNISGFAERTINGFIDGIRDAWSNVTSFIGNVFDNFVTIGENVWNSILNTATGAWANITSGAANFVNNSIESVKNGAVEIWKDVKGAISSVWTDLRNSGMMVWNDLRTGLANVWKSISSGELTRNNIQAVREEGVKGAVAIISNIISTVRGHSEGGIVGGNSYNGDKVIARVNSGEMILNKAQQTALFDFISNLQVSSARQVANSSWTSIANGRELYSVGNNIKEVTKAIFSRLFNSTDNVVGGQLSNEPLIKAKPVGEREYIYTPNRNTSNNGATEVTVRDINVNVNGTIKLDAGNIIKNIDINQLLNDSSFVSALKDIIKTSINNDMNGGRFMNDNATLRGSVGTTTYWGR